MKFLVLSFMLFSVVACDPYGFGFRNNPAFVLDGTLKSIASADMEWFAEVADREALCIYGDEAGMKYLQEKVDISPRNLDLKWTTIDTYYKVPEYVGYWSYFNSRYEINVREKNSGEVYAQVVVECNYGTEGDKDDKLLNLPAKKYKKKECRLIKIIPKTFEALPLPEKCEVLKVSPQRDS